VDALASRFPAYRDVLQPCALAVYEMKHGVALLLAASTAQAQTAAGSRILHLRTLLAPLLAFPSDAAPAAPLLASPDGAEAAAHVLSTASRPPDAEEDGLMAEPTSAQAAPRAHVAEETRLALLRLSLRAGSDALAREGGATQSSWTAHRDQLARVTAAWAAMRAAEAEAESEALSEFRTATRSLAAEAVEAAAGDEEAFYRARFAAGLDPFRDLELQAGLPEYDAPVAAAALPAAAQPPPLPSKALFGDALLADVVSSHWGAATLAVGAPPPLPVGFTADDGADAPFPPPDLAAAPDHRHALSFQPHGFSSWGAALRGARERFSDGEVARVASAAAALSLGGRLLAAAGGDRGDVVQDADVLGGGALRVCLEHMRLSQGAHKGASPFPILLCSAPLCSAARCAQRLHNSAGLSVLTL